jgi:hypothetical protein
MSPAFGGASASETKSRGVVVGATVRAVQSPRVRDHSWGHLAVERVGDLGDAKLWPGGGREWNWAETGTHHEPGIQPDDVQELLDHDPEVVVLTRGRELRLQVMDATLELLESRGVRLVRDETSAAIDAYNDLVDQGVRVAALVHSTC